MAVGMSVHRRRATRARHHRELVLGPSGRRSPSRTAYSAACVRSERPSLASTCETWVLTVFSATPSSSAIRLFERPRAIRRSTSSSRGVSSSACGARSPPCAISSTTRAATAGESGAWPAWAVRIARTSSAGSDVLEQEAGGAGAQRGEQPLVLAEARQHDHARRRRRLAQPRQRRDAVEPRHREVEQHDVGREPLRLGDRGLAVGRLPDDLDVVLQVEERAQALAHDRVVVGDQDADHARRDLEPHARPLPRRRLDRERAAELRARAPPSRSGRAGARAPRRRSTSKPRPSSATHSTSAPAAVLEPHLDVLGVGVAQRVLQRLLRDPEHLRRLLGRAAAAGRRASARSGAPRRAAARRRACAARSRGPPPRARRGAARRPPRAARPSPRARGRARARAPRPPRRGRARAACPPTRPRARRRTAAGSPSRAARARAGCAPRRCSARGCARTAARSRSRSRRARRAGRSAARPRRRSDAAPSLSVR